jgi:hypothetical protein
VHLRNALLDASSHNRNVTSGSGFGK